MSFLLDPPVLFASGLCLGRFVPEGSRRRRISLAVVGLFWGVSGLLYLDVLPWWDGSRLTRGSGWMLNSGLNTRLTRRAGHDVLAILLFAAYPLWMWFGMRLGRQSLSGRTDDTEIEGERPEPVEITT
ncbi:hypothetical protein ACFQE8_15325 [Salinirubellus sp. GCM10025818]|uniref:hypothetical protein n=1 Tax=Salinirubellus TaxID=2162630 RepID=UPI0030CE5270